MRYNSNSIRESWQRQLRGNYSGVVFHQGYAEFAIGTPCFFGFPTTIMASVRVSLHGHQLTDRKLLGFPSSLSPFCLDVLLFILKQRAAASIALNI